MSRQKIIIILTVFIDVLGIGIIIPILPFFVESFGVGPKIVTALAAVFSLFAFFSAPLLGSLSDRIGRRPVLLASLASTCVGWLVFAWAPSVVFLFIGRVIDGLAAGNFSIAQNYLLDIAKDEKERTANLGLIGAIFGVGLIIGPMIGGLLGSVSPRLPFLLVGLLALFNTIFAFLYLSESSNNFNREKISFNPFAPILKSFRQSQLRPGLIAVFIFGVAVAMQQSVFSLFNNIVLGFNAFWNGLLMTAIGFLIALMQGVLLKKILSSRFSEEALLIFSSLILGAGFFFIGVAYLPFFFLGVLGMTFGQSILRVVLTSVLVKKAPVEKQGELMGVLTSVTSLSMIIGPLVAGEMFVLNYSSPFFFAALLSFVIVIIVVSQNRKNKGRVAIDEESLEIEKQRLEIIS